MYQQLVCLHIFALTDAMNFRKVKRALRSSVTDIMTLECVYFSTRVFYVFD